MNDRACTSFEPITVFHKLDRAGEDKWSGFVSVPALNDGAGRVVEPHLAPPGAVCVNCGRTKAEHDDEVDECPDCGLPVDNCMCDDDDFDAEDYGVGWDADTEDSLPAAPRRETTTVTDPKGRI